MQPNIYAKCRCQTGGKCRPRSLWRQSLIPSARSARSPQMNGTVALGVYCNSILIQLLTFLSCRDGKAITAGGMAAQGGHLMYGSPRGCDDAPAGSGPRIATAAFEPAAISVPRSLPFFGILVRSGGLCPALLEGREGGLEAVLLAVLLTCCCWRARFPLSFTARMKPRRSGNQMRWHLKLVRSVVKVGIRIPQCATYKGRRPKPP
jgi:hypothetical protein